jgi:hypothetical protein
LLTEISVYSIASLKDQSLKLIGFKVGQRLALRLSFPLTPFYDPKDAVKFICKDLWFLVFRQQASRLQASKRGVYIIHDSNFPRLHSLSKCVRHFQSSEVDSSVPNSSVSIFKDENESIMPRIKEVALSQMQMTAGVIEGFLAACGHRSSVECILTGPLPSCSFQVTILESNVTVLVHAADKSVVDVSAESAMI